MSGLNISASKTSLAIFGNKKQQASPIRILVLGQSSVGKSALVVRFMTRRFIGEYDSSEQKYTFNTSIDNISVSFEILDSAAGQLENETLVTQLEEHIRWAEAFILMYSVTDKCSFEEVNRLKFLINLHKRRKKIYKNDGLDVPIILVANKSDQKLDRMVSTEEGRLRSQELGCSCFHEISVRENVDDVQRIFVDACRWWRIITNFPKIKRSTSDSLKMSMALRSGEVEPEMIMTRFNQLCYEFYDEKRRSILTFGRSRSALQEEKPPDPIELTDTKEPFRSRAQTDGQILRKKIALASSHGSTRRNSISQRGHVSY